METTRSLEDGIPTLRVGTSQSFVVRARPSTLLCRGSTTYRRNGCRPATHTLQRIAIGRRQFDPIQYPVIGRDYLSGSPGAACQAVRQFPSASRGSSPRNGPAAGRCGASPTGVAGSERYTRDASPTVWSRRCQRVNVSAGALFPPPMRRNVNLLASFDSILPESGGPSSWVKLSTSLTYTAWP
jgi:hypothetical protein